MRDTIPKDNTNADLHDKNLSGQDLSGYIFTNCNLTGVNFSGCKFNSQTDFKLATFGKSVTGQVTNFSNCILTEAIFSKPVPFGRNADERNRVNLTKATIPWDLLGQKIENLDLTGTVFIGMPIKLNAYVFYGVKWNNFDFEGRSLYNSSFSLCDLTGCKMTGSTLDYTSFLMATDLTNVKMNKCSLVKTVFKGSTMTDTDLSYATNLYECIFTNTYLNGTIFDGNDLRNSTFGIPNRMSKSKDHITSFQFAKLDAKFLTENIQYNWQCIDFRNVLIEDFNSVKGNLNNLLAMNSLFNSSLNFESAKLNGANFAGATFSSVNFNDALLNNVNFTNAKTLQGKQNSRRAARFVLPETDSEHADFLLALKNNTTAKIVKMFDRFNIKLGNITCRTNGTTASSFSLFEVVSTNENRDLYTVLKMPTVADPTKFELVAFEELPSTFKQAHLIGCAMQECDFSGANLSYAQLYGSQLIAATLSNTNFQSAQLGNNADIFSISKNASGSGSDYDTFLNALTNSSIYSLIDIFQQNGFALGNARCIPDEKGNAWTITDSNGVEPVIFSVQNIIRSSSSGSDELKVSCLSYTSTTLDDAYMPGVILTSANLTGCSAQGCHLYNSDATTSKATLEKAILIDANFTDANLYKASFTEANLSGAIFTNANLMDASFHDAILEQSSANISFREANLQGANFSSAKNINNANFLNAAVCTPVGVSTYGVFIKRIIKTHPQFEQVLTDLRRPKVASIVSEIYKLASLLVDGQKINIEFKSILSKIITLSSNAIVNKLGTERTFKIKDGNKEYYFIKGYDDQTNVVFNVYKKGLDELYCNIPIVTFTPGTVSSAMIADLATFSNGKLELSSTAKAELYDRPILWSIADKENSKEYTMWWGVTSVDDDAKSALNIRETFTALSSVCKELNIAFRDQSTITKPSKLIVEEDFWELDNGRMDSFLMVPGYITLRIVHKKTSTSESLNFYGYGIRMIGLGANQREVIQDFLCSPTKLPTTLVNDQTIFPNKFTKKQNEDKLIPPDQWMWVEKKLPTPPICVPTATSFCPMPKQTKHKKYKKHENINRAKR